MSIPEKNERTREDKTGILFRIKKTFRIGRKGSDKESTSSTLTGKNPQTSLRNLKTLNLKPLSKPNKSLRSASLGQVQEPDAETSSTASTDEGGRSSFSNFHQATEKTRLEVGIAKIMNEKPEGDSKKMTEDEAEQLRLYKAMHEIRRQMILKEKEFQEEKLEFYKLQLEAENLLGRN